MKFFIIAFITVLTVFKPALADRIEVTGVSIDGVGASLLKTAKPRGALILMPGGNGRIKVTSNGIITKKLHNQLVRTRRAYAKKGFAVLVPEGHVNLAAAIRFMKKFGHVTLVGTSRGTLRAAYGIAEGARPARLVLTAGFLSDASGDENNVMRILENPKLLPPTLIVHHRNDQCRRTLPDGVKPFLKWARGKARVKWLSGGITRGRRCKARSYHGFNGIDSKVVSAVAGFAAK